MKKKIIIGLSSGIDSTITLLILKKIKFYIEAIFIINWEENNICQNKKDLIYIKILCKKYKIKLHIKNFSKKYWNVVFIDFINKLKNGLTPNPDIICNEKIKFKVFKNYIKKFLNFNILATGHYAKIFKKKKKIILKESFNEEKDQTYFLSKIKLINLKNIIFPITNYIKKNIKLLLKKYKCINKNKKNSTGICFIGNNNFKTFLKKYIKKNNGNIIKNKKKIAEHDGIHFYTLGEKIKIKQNIYYIIKKNIQKNILYVTSKNKKKNKIYINPIKIKKDLYKIKIRHQNTKYTCFLIKKNKIITKNILTLLAPGQYISFYKNNICFGSTIVKKMI